MENRATNQAAWSATEPLLVTPELLRARPLPAPDEGGDKEARGRVLCVGGAPEMPGPIMLAAIGALRAGAGKLQIATCASVRIQVGVTIPEARVFALPETEEGGIGVAAVPEIVKRASLAQAMLIGPGMVVPDAIHALIAELLPRLDPATPLVVDAGALDCLAHLRSELRALGGNVILTPHAGEMASILGLEKDDVTSSPREIARQAATDLNAVVALKGAETFVATPAGECYCYTSGDVGLATSGSGDTLAGIIAGLAARGAGPDRAAVWGVYLHGGAGTRLAKRLGRVGYLARELLDEVPPLLALLGGDGSRCAAKTP